MADDKSLAAHTPSTEYMQGILMRRALEHLGVDKKLANKIAPEPYHSDYPTSNKMLDAMLTLALDPIVKPASLKGDLKKMPVLDDLAQTLANKGYFRRYPGGGIGIGSGGGGADSSSAGDAGTAGTADEPFATLEPVTVTASPIGPDDTPAGGQGPGGDTSPADDPGRNINIDPFSPKSSTINLGDISKAADNAPFTSKRALDILKSIIPFLKSPASGTTIGDAAKAFSLLAGGMPGVPTGAGSVLGAFGNAAAGDAASRASSALGSFGFDTNSVALNGVIGGMTGPAGGDFGGQGPGSGALFGGAVSPNAELTSALIGSPQSVGQTGANRTAGSPNAGLFPSAVADLQSRGLTSGQTNPWMLAQSVFPQAQSNSPGITLDKLVTEAKQFFEV